MKRHIRSASLNGAWSQTMKELHMNGEISHPRGRKIKEIRAFNMEITNPRNRIIFNPLRDFSLFYAAGEIAWYLSGSNNLVPISYYNKRMSAFSDDGETLNSAYGFRIFGDKHPLIPFNQFDHVISQLNADGDTRQAIIHLHTPNNKKTRDEVCTLNLQFFIRDNKLEMMTTMRSNDIVWGTSYDVFCFTIIQEILADMMGVELGSYHHYAGSMHVYEDHFGMANDVANSGYSKRCTEMLPLTNSATSIKSFVEFEQWIRTVDKVNAEDVNHMLIVKDLRYGWKEMAIWLAMHRFWRDCNPKSYWYIKQRYQNSDSYWPLLKSKMPKEGL